MRIYRNIDDLPTFKKAVVTIGSFDGVHFGHRKIISRINALAEEVNGESVLITFHPHPRKVIFPNDKDLTLLTSLNEKVSILESLGVDNLVIIPFTIEFSQLHPREYVEKFLSKNFNPAYIVIGYDHRFGLNRSGDIFLLKQYETELGFKVIEIDKQQIEDIAISSSEIRRSLSSGDIVKANSLLCQNYELEGRVVHGEKIGKQIGYPTANISLLDSDKLVPKYGVYAVQVYMDEQSYNGMLYIGEKPTLSGKTRTIEVNIFDFDQEIYDRVVRISFLSFIREDITFGGVDELKSQLGEDRRAVQLFFEGDREDNSKNLNCTVAILNYNGREYLESYLPSVLNSSKEDFEILMIDNASVDESVSFIKEWYPEVQLLEFTKNYGFAKGYNLAISEIKSKYTVVLNSDVKVSEAWLDPLIRAMEDDAELGAVQPKILSLEEPEYFEYAGAAGGFIDRLCYPFCRGRILDKLEKDEGQYDERTKVSWVSGAAMVVRTEIFNKLGGFDPSYFAHFEEIDFSLRLQRAGYKLEVIPNSVVYHLGGGTLAYQSDKKLYLNIRNSLATIVKNFSTFRLLWMIPTRLVLDGMAGLKFIFEGNISKTLSILKAHFSFYYRLLTIIRRKRTEKILVDKFRINYPGSIRQSSYSIIWKYYIQKIVKYSNL